VTVPFASVTVPFASVTVPFASVTLATGHREGGLHISTGAGRSCVANFLIEG